MAMPTKFSGVAEFWELLLRTLPSEWKKPISVVLSLTRGETQLYRQHATVD
jgi:hypothetical protein